MSRERMDDLLSALEGYGWRRLDPREHPRASEDPFRLEGEAVTWAIVRGERSAVVELDFQAFGDLGQRTDDLRDIFYCEARGLGKRLSFAKRQTPEWRENLLTFVLALNASVEGSR